MTMGLPNGISVDDAVKCRSCRGSGLEVISTQGVNLTDFCLCAVGRVRKQNERAAEQAFWDGEIAARRWAENHIGGAT